MVVHLFLFALAAAASLDDPIGAPRVASLEIATGPAAADCPDTESISAAVTRGLGRPALAPPGDSPFHLRVEFNREGGRYQAIVRATGARRGQRIISDASGDCAALADAVTVLLVVLMDSDADLTEAPMPSPARDHDLTLGAGVGVSAGLVGSGAPALSATGALALSDRWSLRLGGSWLPAKSNTYGPGSVDVSMAYARLGACASVLAGLAPWRVQLCAEPQLGVIRGEGVDYTLANRGETRPWLAAAAGVVVGGPFWSRLGWDFEVSVVTPLKKERFVIDGLGVAHEAAAVAVLATLSLHTSVHSWAW